MTTNVYFTSTSHIEITLTQDASFSMTLVVIDSSGTPVNLTNQELVWTVDFSDYGANVRYITSPNPSAGQIDLVLTAFEVEQIRLAANSDTGFHKLMLRDRNTNATHRLVAGSAHFNGTIPGFGGSSSGTTPKKQETTLSVLDFGAKGDGINDDTSAIQATIDAALGGNPAGGASAVRTATATVFLPSGVYKVTGPLKMYSTLGMRFVGAGRDQTTIKPVGTISVLLDINGSYQGTFGNFTVANGSYSAATVDTVIQCDWDPTVSVRSMTVNTLENIYIRELKYVRAYKLSKTATRQMDSLTIRNCTAYGGWTTGEATYWQVGFEHGNGTHANIYNHWSYGVQSAFNKYGVWFRATNGPTLIQGMDLAGNDTDFRVTGSCRIRLDTINSENSQRFYTEDGFAGFVNFVSMQNVRFANANGYQPIAADGRVVKFGYGGSKKLENFFIEYDGGTGIKIYCVNSFDRFTQITTIGLATPVLLANLLEIDAGFAGTTPVSVVHMNYGQYDSSGVQLSSVNFLNAEYVS